MNQHDSSDFRDRILRALWDLRRLYSLGNKTHAAAADDRPSASGQRPAQGSGR